MRIGLIGAGVIGRTLAAAWISAGHTVVVGSRDPSTGGGVDGATTATREDAIRGADVVVFAIPGDAMDATVAALARHLGGKVVIDATNQTPRGPQGGAMHAMAALSGVPGVAAFRAFNTLGWENFAEPVVGGQQADLFYCGPDGAPAAQVEQLVADVGLRPVRVGGPEAADVVDGVTRLWFALVFGQGRGRHLAFKLLEG